MTDFTITYENNIFYCTKNNTKWISVDGEKWYGEEKRITELEKENAELKNKLTEKVTLESLDVVSAKMNDLEKENAELKESYYINRCLHSGCPYLHIDNRNCTKFGGYFTSVSNKNCPMMKNLNANIKLIKAKEILQDVVHQGNREGVERYTIEQAEQFIKENEQ